MANQNSRQLRKLGLCHKMLPGQDPKSRTQSNGVLKPYEIFKGKACVTSFEGKERNPANKRKSPWKGAKRPDIKFTRN
jgi:hypothetical protein